MTTDRIIKQTWLFMMMVVMLVAAPLFAGEVEIQENISFVDQLLRTLSLRDYNTRLVLTGTTLLGLASGVMGTYMLLRRRSLIGDALGHATFPGIALAFMIMVAFGGEGKSLPGLLIGAAVTGLLGVGAVVFIRHWTRLKEDAALGIVLSVWFGIGVALMGLVQSMPGADAAGLESFIYGKTASMVQSDAILIAGAAVTVVIVCTLLFKEFAILSFDVDLARTQGWPLVKIDLIMMLLVTLVVVVGLQAVGLILVVALLIIPAVAARFWTQRLYLMIWIAALIGALSGLVGAGITNLFAGLPAGAVIVLTGSSIFLISLIFGSYRGLVVLLTRRVRLNRRVRYQHLLRALWEAGELKQRASQSQDCITLKWLLQQRAWSQRSLQRLLKSAQRKDLLLFDPNKETVRLTKSGEIEASRVVRNHRLWELYLIHYADIAPSHVDRDADSVEHVIGTDLVRELESAIADAGDVLRPPPSPHKLGVQS